MDVGIRSLYSISVQGMKDNLNHLLPLVSLAASTQSPVNQQMERAQFNWPNTDVYLSCPRASPDASPKKHGIPIGLVS